MNTLIFRGAFLRQFDFRKGASGWFCRLHFTADYTKPIADAMGWGAPQTGATDTDLEGELVAQHLIITPNDPALRNQEVQLDCDTVDDFEYARVKDGEGFNEELRFKVHTVMDGAEAIVGAFARRIGQSASQLRVSYAKQEDLPLTEITSADKPAFSPDGPEAQCSGCEAELPLKPGTLLHTDDTPCLARQEATTAEDGPALVSAREMGGTHQRGKKKGNGSPAVN